MSRIVHIGLGNFHRAHQAWYTHRANDVSPGWSILGVSLRSPAMRDKLAAQQFNYALVTKDRARTKQEQITVIDDILFAPEQLEQTLDLIAAPQTKIISLTITEKGYGLAADGTPDMDVLSITEPKSHAIALLTEGLARREAPATILSCDNLPGNGEKLHAVVTAYAKARGLTLPEGLTYPGTMVDRITPATSAALIEETNGDAAPVETEAFSEWVIEDKFAAARPSWEEVGVQLVEDVAPFELRKLRMLNGAHSLLAYAGVNAGHDYVHEAVADPHLRGMAETVMREAAETLPDGLDTEVYAAALIARFENPNLRHALRQIAMDGSLKLPIRILATERARQERGFDSPACRFAIENWAEFVSREVAQGRALDDPNATEIAKLCDDSPALIQWIANRCA